MYSLRISRVIPPHICYSTQSGALINRLVDAVATCGSRRGKRRPGALAEQLVEKVDAVAR